MGAEKKREKMGQNWNEAEEEELDFQERMERFRFHVQSEHMMVHAVIIILLLCVAAAEISGVEGSSGFSVPVGVIIGVTWMVVSHIIDYLCSRKQYKYNHKLLQFNKINVMAGVVFFSACMDFQPLPLLGGFSAFVLYSFEFVECIDFTTPEERDKAMVVSVACFSAAYIILALLGRHFGLLKLVLLIGIPCFTIYIFVKELYHYVDKYVTYITQLNQDNTVLIQQSDQIHEHSRKVKEAVDLLGVQKIELSKANEIIKLRNQEMRLHNDILSLITIERDMSKVSQNVLDMLMERRYVDAAGIFVEAGMYGNDTPMVQFCGLSDKDNDTIVNSAEDILREIHHFDKEFEITIDTFPPLYDCFAKAELKSMMRLQIVTDGGMCGALLLASKREHVFENEFSDFYVTIAKQLGIAVKNANLYATMENLATRDGLTGIYNRRHFTKLFNDYVTTAMDTKGTIAVALFDIDKFKNVNDTYGHTFGDRVIVAVAQTADKVVKEHGGILGRYGGEEFVLAFLNYDVEKVLPLVQEIHENIKAQELTHNGTVVKINVSIGVTDYPVSCSNPADLLNHADWAMYYSKQHGRGRITIDGEEIRQAMMD